MKDKAIYAMFACVECKANTADLDEYYMVTDEIWAEVGMTPNGGMLCIGCLEDRLQRRLTRSDFPNYPVNSGPYFKRSERLRDRLGHFQHQKLAA